MPRWTNRTVLHTALMRWEPLVVKGGDGYAWIKTLSKMKYADVVEMTTLTRHLGGRSADAARPDGAVAPRSDGRPREADPV